MELYECNYIKLRNLAPELETLPVLTISKAPGALALHLTIVERCKFTTTVNLTYSFSDSRGAYPAPDLQVRIYHDAQVAEVISCGRRRGRRQAQYNRLHHRYSLLEKWRMNRFLQKWLGYCLMQGHHFHPGKPRQDIRTSLQAIEESLLIGES